MARNNPKLLSKFQIRHLKKMCESELNSIKRCTPLSDEQLNEIINTLDDHNTWNLSHASKDIEKLLLIHRDAPGSQTYEEFYLENMIYIIVRLADSLKKDPPPDFDGRWSTVVNFVKRMLGPHLNLGHSFTGKKRLYPKI